MEKMRKPFQGVLNIIRFNWHFYVIAISFTLFSFLLSNFLDKPFKLYIYIICISILYSTLISLSVSFYIYDLSELYKLKWLDQINTKGTIININAGFDETSYILKDKFKNAELVALDFYDPVKHTEISIKRARKAYLQFPGTKQIETNKLEFEGNSIDNILLIFAAHEIRNTNERLEFFKELKRIIKPDGQIFITEHLRDITNFLAFNIGFFHFYSRKSWLQTFEYSGLMIKKEIKISPFVSTFVLYKNGNTH